MGSHGWRIVTETVKQKWGLTMEKNFRATSNSRNEAMFKEASMFAAHLRQVEKDLTAWERDIEAGFTNFRAIMLSPLPRVYEEGHNGAAVPSEPEPSMIGGDVQVERLTSAAQETKKRLEIEVLQPIKQWMVAYRTIQERMKRLEALRLELDSRRRTVADLQVRCERVRATLGTTRARGEVELEVGLRKMQHKEDKMQRTLSQYQEMEQTVYNSLFTLIKDTSVLRDYAAAALLIVQESFQAGYAAFEPSMPQYSASGLQGGGYGVPQVAAPAMEGGNKYDPKPADKFGDQAAGKAAHMMVTPDTGDQYYYDYAA
ncbi:TBC1 domain family member 2A [Raphidocelis subcapitata]|uniref:TBC1 domain family member 2A n=1 Tax=Raphidocelis subcapitata TaxID=307507 RepID=A0A2V0P3B8_9CHLO|nr:TBC1 domain family member 2A [Raphidocelis subcapitata]|eukprot:GBF94371.1 TBC1 domain family member 2A [Raphidocelis subcapitata]